MLVELLESYIDDKNYNLELLLPLLRQYENGGYFLYRVLNKKIRTRTNTEMQIAQDFKDLLQGKFLDPKREIMTAKYETLENKLKEVIEMSQVNEKKIARLLKYELVRKQEEVLKLKVKEICEKLNYTKIKSCSKNIINEIETNRKDADKQQLMFYKKELLDSTKKDANRVHSSFILREYIDLVALYKLEKVLDESFSCCAKKNRLN